MDERIIEFHLEHPGDYPRPIPASKQFPEWLKRMKGNLRPPPAPDAEPAAPFLTVKRCPPFVDAVGHAYLLLLPYDVRFQLDTEGNLSGQSSGLPLRGLSADQCAGTPFEARHVVLLPNPWIVRTPPGYCTLFLSPLNRYDFPFQLLTRLAETDTLTTPVELPAVSLLRPGQSTVITRGTPIAQIIPFQRPSWRHEVSGGDLEHATEQDALVRAGPYYYREQHWRRKEFR